MSRPTSAAGPPWGAAGVRVTFGHTVALDDVSLTATPGVVTAVVGGDGAGKTTLLRCLAGALAPDSGTVIRPGRRATGYFPASTGTYPDLSVAENMAFRASSYSLRGPAVAARTAELIELAGLPAARDRLAGQLSGGMRRKLGVIAAMLHRPALLVLDEPSTGVDPVSRAGLWWLITRAAADGAAVVLATTYLDDAQRTASVLVLDAGRRLAAGTPEEIVAGLPGSVRTVTEEPAGSSARLAWRRGGGWRIWIPPRGWPGSDATPGEVAGVGQPVDPDLQDAVTAAALARELDQAAACPGGRPPVPPAGPAERGDAARVMPRRPVGGRPAPLAECVGVTCRFGRFTAVHEVSVQIRPGEVVGLLGANGAGKTTLIRMLLGLQHASAGRVELLGAPPSRLTRSRIGYVPQGLGLYEDLTAAENMAFAAAVFGSEHRSCLPGGTTPRTPRRLPPDIARESAVPAGLLPLGLQRRLAFAEALSHDPDLLILDEPTSGVDPLGRARLWDTIGRAAAAGAGVLVSTHYMEEAGECDRLIVMAAGEVVAAGTAGGIIGGAQVTVVQTDAWAAAFARLAEAGIAATLAGRTLRVPGVSAADVAAALRAGDAGTASASLLQAPATLEERFFELAAGAGQKPVPA
jgi:ABC-2 type transport system ATP-binding protein